MCFTSNVLTVDALLRTVRKVNLWCHVQAVLYKNVVVGKVYISKELILFVEDKSRNKHYPCVYHKQRTRSES